MKVSGDGFFCWPVLTKVPCTTKVAHARNVGLATAYGNGWPRVVRSEEEQAGLSNVSASWSGASTVLSRRNDNSQAT